MQPPQFQPQFNADQMPGAGQQQQLQYNAPPNQQQFQPSAFNPPPPQMNRPNQPFNPASFQAPPTRPTLGSMPPNQLQGSFQPPPISNTQINQPPLMNSQTQLTNQISNLSLSTPTGNRDNSPLLFNSNQPVAANKSIPFPQPLQQPNAFNQFSNNSNQMLQRPPAPFQPQTGLPKPPMSFQPPPQPPLGPQPPLAPQSAQMNFPQFPPNPTMTLPPPPSQPTMNFQQPPFANMPPQIQQSNQAFNSFNPAVNQNQVPFMPGQQRAGPPSNVMPPSQFGQPTQFNDGLNRGPPPPFQPQATPQPYMPSYQQQQQQQQQQPQFDQYSQPPQQQQSQQKMDMDQIPNPIEVMQVNSTKYGGEIFETNEAGKMPPLTSTDFICKDMGNCNPKFIRSTIYSIPCNPDLLKQSKLPIALCLTPFSELKSEEVRKYFNVINFNGHLEAEQFTEYFFNFQNSLNKVILKLIENFLIHLELTFYVNWTTSPLNESIFNCFSLNYLNS